MANKIIDMLFQRYQNNGSVCCRYRNALRQQQKISHFVQSEQKLISQNVVGIIVYGAQIV